MIDVKIASRKLVMFLARANLRPNIILSAGSCTIPTVTQANIKAVTANIETPFESSSPPII